MNRPLGTRSALGGGGTLCPSVPSSHPPKKEMKRLLALSALSALMLVPSSARATGSKPYDFCGGSYSGYTGFAFCASVTVTVTAASSLADGLYHAPGSYTVSMDIVNKSGENGSFLNSMFIQIGLDN